MAKIRSYNPFNKHISEIKMPDLLILKEVHEGWYVDYKSEALSARSYAKAIAAMANTYGGWIFVGVKEESKDNNVAGHFPGIEEGTVDENCQRIRQSVSEHLNPNPFFEVFTVESPEGQTSGKIICIHVPASPKAPILHSDGRIYRRVNDSSEPVAETRREVVDHLIRRSIDFEEYYEDWYESDPITSKGEEDLTYIRVLMTPDYWIDENIWYEGSTEDFKDLLNSKSDGVFFSLDYKSVYPKPEGFVCRAPYENDARQISPTLIVNRDLRNEFWLPIPYFDIDQHYRHTQNDNNLHSLSEYCRDNGYQNCTAIDFTQVFGSIDGLFTLQKKFQDYVGYNGKTFVKYKIINTWRRIPMISASPTELHWDRFGVPMILTDEVSLAKGGSIETFMEIDLNEPIEETAENFMLSMTLFMRILHDVGLGLGSYEEFSRIVSRGIRMAYEKANKVLPDNDATKNER